jgi:hypothetical protein
MKITSINHEPEKYGNQLWGSAIDGDGKRLNWFYVPRRRLRLHREERPGSGMWIVDADLPRWAQRAVASAVRAAKAV